VNDSVLWLIASLVALGLASFAIPYGIAALIIGRQNRKRGVHLRNRLRS
jgi:hypothetical protein